jgi:hypothetical protein
MIIPLTAILRWVVFRLMDFSICLFIKNRELMVSGFNRIFGEQNQVQNIC